MLGTFCALNGKARAKTTNLRVDKVIKLAALRHFGRIRKNINIGTYTRSLWYSWYSDQMQYPADFRMP